MSTVKGEKDPNVEMEAEQTPAETAADLVLQKQEETSTEVATTAMATDTAKEPSNDQTKTDAKENPDGKTGDEVTEKDSSERTENSWDHTNRRVVVHNVFKFLNTKAANKLAKGWVEEFKKKITNVPIEMEKIRKPPKDIFAIITFKDKATCQPFVDFINEAGFTNRKGNTITAKLATDSGKRKADGSDDHRTSKRARSEGQFAAARRHVTEDEIKDRITPLWKLSDEEQGTSKMKDMAKRCCRKVVVDLKMRLRQLAKDKSRKKTVDGYTWLEGKRCIEMAPLISAPTPLRNKSEFTFGYRYLFDEKNGIEKDKAQEENADATKEGEAKEEGASKEAESTEPPKVPAVGFMVTGWAGGVSRPHCCKNIPAEVCKLVDIVDEFLATSPLPPYDTKVHQGFWRTMTVRSSRRTKECMIIIMHTPAKGGLGDQQVEGSDHTEHFEKERARLVSILTAADLPVPDQDPLKVTSIFFQEFDGVSHPPPDYPVQHVHGKKFLTEQLGKCTFQISPGAFFQVNTEGAELLYEIAVDKVREVCKEPENTLLFDVCCGTGTIGLTCMKEGAVGKVIGVDISQPAIDDAVRNAELNGFDEAGTPDDEKKTRFVASRAEKVLYKEIAKLKESPMQFVAIVDPAREGLHSDVVKTLRANEKIQRIVYVSCNPTATLVRDAILLCQPSSKKYSGLPFKVTSASPVDMFPLTDHCEMVMAFDRMGAEEAGEENS